jgi:cardiolipin synthase
VSWYLAEAYVWIVSPLLAILGFLLALALLAHLLKAQRSPTSTLAWLLVILLAPYVGVPIYLIFGGRKIRRMAGRKERVYHRQRDFAGGAAGHDIERILRSYGIPPATGGNSVSAITSGEEAYRQLMVLIDRAERTIHITTYILGRDAVGQAIVARLAERARAGVEVRLLLDSVGSWRVGRRFLAPLTQAGAKVAFFMPVIHIPFRGRANLRNHRKIAVIDGRHALTGGMNFAEEYMGPTPSPARWGDFSVVISGPAVHDLGDLFRSDWRFATGEDLPPDDPSGIPTEPANAIVEVVASGPDVEGDPLYEALISVAFTATQRIWVVTPYFVPDETLARALDLAARRGVDVRLIVPEHSNHLMADLARASYLRQVHDAGGHVLLYKMTMIHAKVVLVDDRLAIVGSANMDMRSLFLNYEVAVFLYSAPQIESTAAWIHAMNAECVHGLPAQGRVRELAEDVVRLLSPLL